VQLLAAALLHGGRSAVAVARGTQPQPAGGRAAHAAVQGRLVADERPSALLLCGAGITYDNAKRAWRARVAGLMQERHFLGWWAAAAARPSPPCAPAPAHAAAACGMQPFLARQPCTSARPGALTRPQVPRPADRHSRARPRQLAAARRLSQDQVRCQMKRRTGCLLHAECLHRLVPCPAAAAWHGPCHRAAHGVPPSPGHHIGCPRGCSMPLYVAAEDSNCPIKAEALQRVMQDKQAADARQQRQGKLVAGAHASGGRCTGCCHVCRVQHYSTVLVNPRSVIVGPTDACMHLTTCQLHHTATQTLGCSRCLPLQALRSSLARRLPVPASAATQKGQAALRG